MGDTSINFGRDTPCWCGVVDKFGQRLGIGLSIKSRPDFENIEGYSDIKDIIIRALETDENYNLLLIGPPASSKTLFLMGILDIRKDAVYFDGCNTTSRILDVLEEQRSKIILLDEVCGFKMKYVSDAVSKSTFELYGIW